MRINEPGVSRRPSVARRISTMVAVCLLVALAYVVWVFGSTVLPELANGPPVRLGGRVSGPCEVLATDDLVVYDGATGEQLAVGDMDRPWLSSHLPDGRCAVVFDVYPVPRRDSYEVVVAGTWSATVSLADGGGGLTLQPTREASS